MTSQCSVALLESALAGNMSAEREESLHRHLKSARLAPRRLSKWPEVQPGARRRQPC